MISRLDSETSSNYTQNSESHKRPLHQINDRISKIKVKKEGLDAEALAEKFDKACESAFVTNILLKKTIDDFKRVEKQKKDHKSYFRAQYSNDQLMNLLMIQK